MLGFLRKADWPALLGVIRIDDDLVARIRRRVHARLGVLQIKARDRRGAQVEIEEAARWEIVSVLRELNPGRSYNLKPSWPLTHALLADDGACMVGLWIGHDYADDGNGIAPIPVTVNWRLEAGASDPVKTAAPKKTEPAKSRALQTLEANRRGGAR
jgi:hypothetical protein